MYGWHCERVGWHSSVREQWQLPKLFSLDQADKEQLNDFYGHWMSHFQAQNHCFGMDATQKNMQDKERETASGGGLTC